MKHLSLICLLFIGSLTTTFAQELDLPALSPTAHMTQAFSTSDIEVSYSRPSMRGRQIFGQLVAYGQVWRTGANGATKVKFKEEVTVGGTTLKAGEYALYTVPGRTEWEIILNKGTGNWGVSGYSKDDDVARFKVIPAKTDGTVQTFTINITDITFNTCNIELTWENTKVVIPVIANNKERIAKSIDKAINEPSLPYYRAASYYNEIGENLDKALVYVDKALEENPKAFYMWHLRARIGQNMGNKEVAIKSAERAIELSKGSAYEAEQYRNNTKIINEMK